jgi:hypothetical protein
MKRIKAVLGLVVAACLFATAVQAQIGVPQSYSIAKVNVGTASNLNWVIHCDTAKEVFLTASWALSNTITAGASNLTFFVQSSADGSTWTGIYGATGGNSSSPAYTHEWIGEGRLAGTNNVVATNLSVAGIRALRIAYVTNGATTYMIATNVVVKAWLK